MIVGRAELSAESTMVQFTIDESLDAPSARPPASSGVGGTRGFCAGVRCDRLYLLVAGGSLRPMFCVSKRNTYSLRRKGVRHRRDPASELGELSESIQRAETADG